MSDCEEAYVNASAERDMYEVAYRDMRTTILDVLDHGGRMTKRSRAALERVVYDGEPSTLDAETNP